MTNTFCGSAVMQPLLNCLRKKSLLELVCALTLEENITADSITLLTHCDKIDYDHFFCCMILQDLRSRYVTEQCLLTCWDSIKVVGPCCHRCSSWSCDSHHRSSLTSLSGQALEVFKFLFVLVKDLIKIERSLTKSPGCLLQRNYHMLWQFCVSEKCKLLHVSPKLLLSEKKCI